MKRCLIKWKDGKLGLSLLVPPRCCRRRDTWIKDDGLVPKVEDRVRKIQRHAVKSAFDEDRRASSILAAEQIAAKVNRPVFLFTYNARSIPAAVEGGAFGLRAGSLSDSKVIDLLTSTRSGHQPE